MDSIIGLHFFALLVFLQLSGQGTAETTINEVRTQAGQEVSLACSLSVTHGELARITWTMDPTLKIPIANVSSCTGDRITDCTTSLAGNGGKYSLSGDLRSAIQLTIADITLADNGVYECKAVTGSGINTHLLTLIVTHPPEVQAIEIYDVLTGAIVPNQAVLHVVINQVRSLNCTVPSPANPPVTLSWSAPSDVTLQTQGQTNRASAANSPLVTSSRITELSPTLSDSGKNISCIAEHDGLILQTNATLRVGTLPETPTNLEVLPTSITVDSFTVTWQQRSPGSDRQTFTVTLCLVASSIECMQHEGITQTRLKIDNLQSFSLYQITVKSVTVFGASEESEAVEKYTRPLSPDKLGVSAVYDSGQHAVVISLIGEEPSSSLSNLCFQLVYAELTGGATQELSNSPCGEVGDTLPLPADVSLSSVRLVSYGNSIYSQPMEITAGDKATSINSIWPIVGAVWGAIIFIVIIIVIVCVVKKRRPNQRGTTQSRPGHARSRGGLPSQPLDGVRTMDVVDHDADHRYSGVKYQEVNDPPTCVNKLVDNKELYAMHHSYAGENGRASDRGPAHYSARVYGSKVKPGGSSSNDAYGYVDPNA